MMEQLPDEILSKIMGHLSTSDILKKMALVSKRFNRLSRDQNLIKRIEFKSFELTSRRRTRSWTEERMEKFYNDFFEVLKNARKLKFLSLHFEPPMLERLYRILIQLSANHEFLEEFYIQTRDIRLDLLYYGMPKVLDGCRKLKILKLENTYAVRQLDLILATIARFNSRSLQELHLDFYGTHCDQPLYNFLKMLIENMPQLQHICLAFDSGAMQQISTVDKKNILQEITSKKNIRIEIRDIRHDLPGQGFMMIFVGGRVLVHF